MEVATRWGTWRGELSVDLFAEVGEEGPLVSAEIGFVQKLADWHLVKTNHTKQKKTSHVRYCQEKNKTTPKKTINFQNRHITKKLLIV
jgi:hypothetical protein